MTPFPYSVGINTLLCDAKIYMHQHEIHHLPVIDGDNIVGLIDARVFENQNYESIGDLNLSSPQVFDLNERLDNVLEIMADKRLDTVLITKNSKLVGIFTESDAYMHFSRYLREEFGPHGGGDNAA